MNTPSAKILQRGGSTSYDKALKALLPDSRDWWKDFVEDAEYPPTAEGLAGFIRTLVLPDCMSAETEAKERYH